MVRALVHEAGVFAFSLAGLDGRGVAVACVEGELGRHICIFSMLWHTLLACWWVCACMQGVCCVTLREALACSAGSRGFCATDVA